MSACGDDYFEPATDHSDDAPNALLIFSDSTRADYIGAYNPDSLAKTPNLDALAADSLRFSRAVPEAMPTGPARRALLTGVRSFPFRNYVPTKGLPVGPGWTPIPDHHPIFTEVMAEAGVETAYCTDNPFLIGPRFANFRRTLDEVKPSFSQGAYRFLNKPFKRPATRSTIERYLLPELSDSVEVGRLRAMAGWNSIYREREAQYPTARVVRSGINLVDDLEKQAPVLPRASTPSTPTSRSTRRRPSSWPPGHPRASRPRRGSFRSSPSRPRTRGRSTWTSTTRPCSACASSTPPRSPTSTSGSGG